MKTEYKKVSVYELDPGAENENSHEVEEIQNLASNIEEVGLLNPITVTPVNGGYEIIAGRARWRAFQELEREEIPAVIIKDVEEPTKSLQRADENYYRTNLDTYERAKLMWNLSKQNPESKANLSTKQLCQHFNLGKDQTQLSVSVGEFLDRIPAEQVDLPNSIKVTGQIVRHYRKKVGTRKYKIPDELLDDVKDKIKEAKSDSWSEKDVRLWRKSRKEGAMKEGQHSKKGATVELERKRKEKSQPTEEQKQNREDLATKVKESKEKDEAVEVDLEEHKSQIENEKEDVEQQDRILDQRKQKHRRERHKVQRLLADIKDQANDLRDNLKEIQNEDKYQYIDQNDGVLLIEVVGRLVVEAQNTAEILRGEFKDE